MGCDVEGDPCRLVNWTAVAEDGKTTFVGRFDARTRLTPGDTARLAVDVDELHFFDVGSGLAIR